MSRAAPPIEIEVRRAPSRREKLECLEAHAQRADAGGFRAVPCVDCGETVALIRGERWEPVKRFEFDHDKARALGGKIEDGVLVPRCYRPCHKIKTRQDRDAIDKAKRQGGRETGQWSRRARGAQRYRWPRRPFGS
ncbi:MAG: hypothetical protein AB7M12_00585 [Hyphomonadaceae bacterium]